MQGKWTWLVSINIGLGCLTTLLMMCVQCSDPGIINRSQNEAELPFLAEQEKNVRECGEMVLNFSDNHLSLNSYEKQQINE